MATTVYSASMSLDGYIAGPGGDMSWLAEHLGDTPPTEQLARRTAVLLVGNRTFTGDDPNSGTEAEGAFGGTWDGPQVVLTHRPPAEPVPGVTFCTDLPSALTAARSAAGDDCVDVLGADVARQLLDAGELDEVLVVVVPVMLGGGTRLLDRPGGPPVRLETVEAVVMPHATSIWTRVLR